MSAVTSRPWVPEQKTGCAKVMHAQSIMTYVKVAGQHLQLVPRGVGAKIEHRGANRAGVLAHWLVLRGASKMLDRLVAVVLMTEVAVRMCVVHTAEDSKKPTHVHEWLRYQVASNLPSLSHMTSVVRCTSFSSTGSRCSAVGSGVVLHTVVCHLRTWQQDLQVVEDTQGHIRTSVWCRLALGSTGACVELRWKTLHPTSMSYIVPLQNDAPLVK